MSDIEIRVCVKRADKSESSASSPTMAVYKPESPGIYKHPRRTLGYVSEDADGSITVERTDGKRVKLVLP